MEERSTLTREAVGSNPTTPANLTELEILEIDLCRTIDKMPHDAVWREMVRIRGRLMAHNINLRTINGSLSAE